MYARTRRWAKSLEQFTVPPSRAPNRRAFVADCLSVRRSVSTTVSGCHSRRHRSLPWVAGDARIASYAGGNGAVPGVRVALSDVAPNPLILKRRDVRVVEGARLEAIPATRT